MPVLGWHIFALFFSLFGNESNTCETDVGLHVLRQPPIFIWLFSPHFSLGKFQIEWFLANHLNDSQMCRPKGPRAQWFLRPPVGNFKL